LEIFRIGGNPPDTNYLFLGNYVDFGFWSIETLCLLLCLRAKYPSRISLLRGAHECRTMSRFGFYGECMKKYGSASVWRLLTDLFDYLPIGATIDERMFAVHGGLSQHLVTLNQIRVLDRFRELPDKGPLTELMWSNPEPTKEGYHPNR
jgi:serine/threonine-protein phosphatase PPG1